MFVGFVVAVALGLPASALATTLPPVLLGLLSHPEPVWRLVRGERVCSGEVPSFDGSTLDVDLTQPAPGTGSTHPLIIMLHGFGNNKHEWESTTNEGDGADKWHWNNHWFAEHGYYVLTYTARGFRDDGATPPISRRLLRERPMALRLIDALAARRARSLRVRRSASRR